MTGPDLFPIPPDQPDGDAHWDDATSRVLGAVTRDRSEEREWFIREPRRAWGTAMIVAVAAAVIMLVPLTRRAPSIEITLLPADPLGRAFAASSKAPLLGSLVIDMEAR
jgi:hypothetical protein